MANRSSGLHWAIKTYDVGPSLVIERVYKNGTTLEFPLITIPEAQELKVWLNSGGLDPYPPGIDTAESGISKPPRRFRVQIYSADKWLAVDRQTGEAALRDSKDDAVFWCRVRGGKP